jgi:hypothetical protein
MYIKKFWNQGLLFKGMGFATTARLQVAHACSWVIYADKSGQQCRRPATDDYHESEWALRHDFRKKLKVSIFDRKWRQQMSLSVPLLRLKPRRDAFVLGQGTQIFLRGLIISRSFWLNLDLLLLDVMGSQFLMRRWFIRY